MKKSTFAALFVALVAGSASANGTSTITQAAHSKSAMTVGKQNTGGSPLTLNIDDAAGNPLRLVYAPGVGWRYAPESKSAKSLVTTAFPPATPQSADALLLAEEPLTVFIDGPSGFTYVWIRDKGWKFVGHLRDRNP